LKCVESFAALRHELHMRRILRGQLRIPCALPQGDDERKTFEGAGYACQERAYCEGEEIERQAGGLSNSVTMTE
jgi:hypothetical protein